VRARNEGSTTDAASGAEHDLLDNLGGQFLLLDGVTGRQPTVVAAVAVPQSDEVEDGVRLGLPQFYRQRG
jgi:hypothetical protein